MKLRAGITFVLIVAFWATASALSPAAARARCMSERRERCFKKYGWKPVCATKVAYTGLSNEYSWVYAYANDCEAKAALKCDSPPGLSTVQVTGTATLPSACLKKYKKNGGEMGASCHKYCPGYVKSPEDAP